MLVTSVNNHSNKSLQSCAPFSKFRLFTSQPDLMTDLTIVQGTDSAIRTLLINFYCEFPFQAPDMDGAVFSFELNGNEEINGDQAPVAQLDLFFP